MEKLSFWVTKEAWEPRRYGKEIPSVVSISGSIVFRGRWEADTGRPQVQSLTRLVQDAAAVESRAPISIKTCLTTETAKRPSSRMQTVLQWVIRWFAQHDSCDGRTEEPPLSQSRYLLLQRTGSSQTDTRVDQSRSGGGTAP